MVYAPLVFIFIFILIIIGAFLFALIEIGIINYAFSRIGIAPDYLFGLLFLSIFGSFVNIPIARIPQERLVPAQSVTYFGFRYVIPAHQVRRETIVAINLGGALVPLGVSVYLMTRVGHIAEIIAGIALLSLAINRIARPVVGLGIAVPALIPPILAAVYALLVAPENSAAVAYVTGTMSTLIGADILNLRKIKNLGAPVVSIGGAGTFDGIFITGIFAVLLASL